VGWSIERGERGGKKTRLKDTKVNGRPYFEQKKKRERERKKQEIPNKMVRDVRTDGRLEKKKWRKQGIK